MDNGVFGLRIAVGGTDDTLRLWSTGNVLVKLPQDKASYRLQYCAVFSKMTEYVLYYSI